MRNKTTFLIVSVLVFLSASPAKVRPLESSGAKGSDKDYFYCVLRDESQNKRVFFTAVYSGDDSAQRTYELQFTGWVEGRYNGRSGPPVIGDASCRFDKSHSVAMMSREDDKTAAGRENRAVIETNWHP
jgi:hypothetical protein